MENEKKAAAKKLVDDLAAANKGLSDFYGRATGWTGKKKTDEQHEAKLTGLAVATNEL